MPFAEDEDKPTIIDMDIITLEECRYLCRTIHVLVCIIEVPIEPSRHTVSVHHRPASETPLEWRFAGGPIVYRF